MTTAHTTDHTTAQSTAQPSVGTSRTRIDGPLKVTGTAPYAYEHAVDQPLHLYPLTSTIARGEIKHIDTAAAEKVADVLLVITPTNAPRLWLKTDAELVILQSTAVHFTGQFIGAVKS